MPSPASSKPTKRISARAAKARENGCATDATPRPTRRRRVCCGSKNLAAYGRWHVARDNANRSYRDLLRPLLASDPRTNTVC